MSRLLVPHLVAAASWWPLLAAVPLAALAQFAVLLDEPPERAVLTGLWLAAGVLGAGAAFALPDAMASTVITPVPRWVRQWLRTGLAVTPAGLIWISLYLLAERASGVDLTGFVALQAAVCGLLPVAVTAVATRRRDSPSGALPGPVAQGVVLVGTLFLPDRSSPWSVPSGEWTAVQRAWPVALALVLVTLLLANREVPRATGKLATLLLTRREAPRAMGKPT
jgi:hypothetical protein